MDCLLKVLKLLGFVEVFDIIKKARYENFSRIEQQRSL